MYGNIRLSDQICAQDVLFSQKFLTSIYNMAVTEAASGDLRRDLMEIQREEQDAGFRAFSCMNQKGWYRTSPADTRMINEVRSQAQQIASQIGFGYRGGPGGPTGFAPGFTGGAGLGAGPTGGGFGQQGGTGTYGGGIGGGFGYQGGTPFGGAGGYTGYHASPGGPGGQAGGGPGYGSNPSFEVSKELTGNRFEGTARTRRDEDERMGGYGTYGGAGGSDGTAGRTGRSTVVHGDTRMEGRNESAEIAGKGIGNTFEGSTGFEERSGFPGSTSGQGHRM